MSLPMSAYNQLLTRLVAAPHTWLITGVAGFIGSNLLETLLKLNQRVVGLDSFATGHQRNLDEVQTLVTPAQWANFNFIPGDIRELADCQKACQGVDYVLHQAALGSVPRSLEDPITTNGTNITGFLNMLVAARDARVKSFTYAASSSTYGDHPGLPKVEDVIGQPLSPYAVTKYVNELYANVFACCYGFNTIGQRQSIGIARALYKQASVLVFDEATSALDNAIEGLGRDLSILLIARRLTTVRRCDTIVELEHGRVVAQGTYEQLLECSPSFRRMARAI